MASETTPDSCILNWQPPKDDGGSPISNYIVEKQDQRTGTWEPCSKFVRGTTYEVLNLTENHEYKFRVSAENEHGVSEALETETSVIAAHPWSKLKQILKSSKELCHQKTCPQCFQPGPTQSGLYSHRRWLQA